MPRATSTRKLLGKKVRKLRKLLNLSQEDLGELAGVHRTYIGSIERGEQNASVDTIHRIARALKVSPHELLP